MALFHENPKPGDLIEISRPGFQHWAIYVGDGYVVHLFPSGDNLGNVSSGIFPFRIIKAVVKRELLKNVVRNCRYEINNHLDKEHTPQLLYNILSSAYGKIGEEMNFSVHGRNCEHFVNYLRYGIDYNKQFSKEPSPGDMIEIFHIGYQNWALYVGDGYVIHLDPLDCIPWAASAGLSSGASWKIVKLERLKILTGIWRYKVNNYLDNRFPPRPVNKIINSALEKIGDIVACEFQTTSSEHFVTNLRYGIAHSEQAVCAQKEFGIVRNFGYSIWNMVSRNPEIK